MAAYHMAKANFSELHTNSKDQGQKFSYWKEGLVTRNTPVKYEIRNFQLFKSLGHG